MNEHTLCCGTVADKAKLCAEIDKRDSVIRAQQRRIGELLQERDEALAKQVICASGCKDREALHEALVKIEKMNHYIERMKWTTFAYDMLKESKQCPSN